MDVKLPDGTIVRNVPEGTTKAQLMAKLGRAQPKPQGVTGWISDNVLSPINEAIIGVPEGIYNAAAAVTDPIAKLVVGDEAVRQAQGQRKAVSVAARRAFTTTEAPIARDVGRIAGSLAIPLPGKKLQEGGRLARAGYRAMQGAVGGAAVRDPGDESAADEAAIGATANVFLPPALRWLAATRPAQAVGGVVSRAPITNWLTATGDDLAQALLQRTGFASPKLPTQALSPATIAAREAERQSTRALEPLGRKAEARAARFSAAGVNEPTTAMVTRNPAAFKTERKLAQIEGAGDDLSSQIQNVEQSLVAAGRGLVDRMGGAKGAEATGKSASDVLDAKQKEMQAVTGRLYDKVREARGEENIGNLDTLRKSFDESELADNPVFEDMTAAIGKRLGRWAEREGGTIGLSLRQAEELRRFIGNLGNSSDPTARLARKQLIDALDDDVVNAVGDDAFKAARASARARFEEFKKTVPGKIAEEDIPPEKLTQRLLSMPLDDLRSVKQSYLTGTDEQIARGTKAWNDLRAQGIDDLLKSAITDEGAISGTKLLNNFKTRSGNLRVLLDPADYKQLRRLVLASRDATVAPPTSSAYGSDTAPMIANLLGGATPKAKNAWLRFIGRLGAHGAAGATMGPLGNVALEAGRAATATAAERGAAQQLARRVELARDPQAYAKAVESLRKAAKTNPAAKSLLDQVTGAGTVATANQ